MSEAPRRTPYELVFDRDAIETRLFPTLLQEAERFGVRPEESERLLLLPTVTQAAQELAPPEADASLLLGVRRLVVHGFQFWRYGKRLFFLDEALARQLVTQPPRLAPWDATAPYPALYLQLPAHLFWSSIEADVPPEPVDGFFVCWTERRDAWGRRYAHLDALMVLGLRRFRAGFSVVPLEAEVGGVIGLEWADEPSRAEGEDFASVLPGAEWHRSYSIVTTGEALKLVLRALWFADQFPDALVWEEPAAQRGTSRPAAVAPSRLPFVRLRALP